MKKHAPSSIITAKGRLASTCPPPFVQQGSVHRFLITGSLQFTNPNSIAIPITLIIKVVAHGSVLEEQKYILTVPASPEELYHTISTDYQYTAQSGHTRITVWLMAFQDNVTDSVVTYWHVCEFTVQ